MKELKLKIKRKLKKAGIAFVNFCENHPILYWIICSTIGYGFAICLWKWCPAYRKYTCKQIEFLRKITKT